MSQQIAQSDKRQFSRFANDSSVILEKGGQQWKSLLHDISLKGVLVARPDNWAHENEDEFNITVQLEDHASEIKMHVVQKHVEDDHLGFQCLNIDLDSMIMLRRLVELNMGDDALLDREISNMVVQ